MACTGSQVAAPRWRLSCPLWGAQLPLATAPEPVDHRPPLPPAPSPPPSSCHRAPPPPHPTHPRCAEKLSRSPAPRPPPEPRLHVRDGWAAAAQLLCWVRHQHSDALVRRARWEAGAGSGRAGRFPGRHRRTHGAVRAMRFAGHPSEPGGPNSLAAMHGQGRVCMGRAGRCLRTPSPPAWATACTHMHACVQRCYAGALRMLAASRRHRMHPQPWCFQRRRCTHARTLPPHLQPMHAQANAGLSRLMRPPPAPQLHTSPVPLA